jgi:uncharacterized protein YegP (UPF0339 family)
VHTGACRQALQAPTNWPISECSIALFPIATRRVYWTIPLKQKSLKLKVSNSGKYMFKMTPENGQNIGKSEWCNCAAAIENSIESVKTNGQDTAISGVT